MSCIAVSRVVRGYERTHSVQRLDLPFGSQRGKHATNHPQSHPMCPSLHPRLLLHPPRGAPHEPGVAQSTQCSDHNNRVSLVLDRRTNAPTLPFPLRLCCLQSASSCGRLREWRAGLSVKIAVVGESIVSPGSSSSVTVWVCTVRNVPCTRAHTRGKGAERGQ